jgi:hypothetical protein
VNIIQKLSIENSILDHVNDIFVLSTSGVPYYSTCFGGEICKTKPDHLLQSGFIAALFQFSLEFGQSNIKEVEFEDGKMVFDKRVVNDRELLFVFFTTCEPNTKDLRGVVDEAANAFVKNFNQKLDSSFDIVNVDDYKEFSNILLDLELINRKAMRTVPLLKKKTFLQKLDQFLRRN